MRKVMSSVDSLKILPSLPPHPPARLPLLLLLLHDDTSVLAFGFPRIEENMFVPLPLNGYEALKYRHVVAVEVLSINPYNTIGEKTKKIKMDMEINPNTL
jgi:hypothetical protein